MQKHFQKQLNEFVRQCGGILHIINRKYSNMFYKTVALKFREPEENIQGATEFYQSCMPSGQNLTKAHSRKSLCLIPKAFIIATCKI